MLSKKALKAIVPGVLCAMGLAFTAPAAEAWTDQTHMAIAKAAGMKSYHNACVPDVAKTLSFVGRLGKNDGQAHFFDAAKTPTMDDLEAQIEMIGYQRDDAPDGYIMGAIVNSVRKAKSWTEMGKYDDYNYAIVAHYCGDLSMPLHMSVYDDFNRSHHLNIDQTLNHSEVKYDVQGADLIAKNIVVDKNLKITNEDEQKAEILKVAQESFELAQTIRKENREITKEEALQRCGRSASLFRAILIYCGKTPVDM